ncbi:putative reverse transcriptase, RNA-dependent DNA polymerase, partial [Tanacetum coccineum]
MEELKVDFRKLNTDDDRKSYYAEVKSIRSSKIDCDESNTRPTNLKDKFEQCLKEAGKRQEIQNEWMKKIMISTDLSLKDHDSSIKRLEQKVNHLAQLISTQNPKHTGEPKTETFGEKVKRPHCSPTLQNKLPPKETDPGSFILPCMIGNHPLSNALADLGASISIMPYSLFKRLELGSLKPIKMAIEMADRSIQSPRGVKENVLVKISNLVFPVDFIILDITKYESVLIILGRPMLATAYAKIDDYGKKISLGVGNNQVVFTIDNKESPASISPVFVINEFNNTQEFGSAGDFDDHLSPERTSQDIISLSPSESTEIKENFGTSLYDTDKRISMGLDKLVDIDDIEFLEKGLTEVLFGQPFKEQIGLVEDQASVDNVGVDLEKGTVDTSAKYNSVNDKENVNAKFKEKNVESDQCNNTKCDGKSGNTNRNEKLNGAWDKSSKFADIFAASKLDNRLLMIPTEISESGEE